MHTDFSIPQKQSKFGVLVLFSYTLAQYLKQFWPFFIITIVKFKGSGQVYSLLSIAAFIVLVAIVSYLKYINFSFYINSSNNEFVISEGILKKTVTSIQLNKIQQVNINQSFVQKIVGVFELSLDTAGSNKNEGTIKAIDKNIAAALKSCLLDAKKTVEILDHDSEIEDLNATALEKPLLKISFLTLLKVGLTSSYGKSLSLILLFFVSILQYFKEFNDAELIDNSKVDQLFNFDIFLEFALYSIVLIFLVIIIVNFFRVTLKYFGYTIENPEGSLFFSYGLLSSKSNLIKLDKIQKVAVTSNYFQKKMNLFEIEISHANSDYNKEKMKTGLEIPGCDTLEKDKIIQLIFNEIPQKGLQLQPNFRKLVFSLFIFVALPTVLFFVVRFNFIEVAKYQNLVPFYIIFISLIHYFGFRNNKLFVSENYIIKQSGSWDITTEIVTPSKIQAITVSQLFWHKKLNIGSIKLHTAAGDLAFQLGNFETIKEYANIWLYLLESKNKNWM